MAMKFEIDDMIKIWTAKCLKTILTENKPELHLHVKYMKERTLVKVFIKFKKMNKKNE
jgi:hypothetical protein